MSVPHNGMRTCANADITYLWRIAHQKSVGITVKSSLVAGAGAGSGAGGS